MIRSRRRDPGQTSHAGPRSTAISTVSAWSSEVCPVTPGGAGHLVQGLIQAPASGVLPRADTLHGDGAGHQVISKSPGDGGGRGLHLVGGGQAVVDVGGCHHRCAGTPPRRQQRCRHRR